VLRQEGQRKQCKGRLHAADANGSINCHCSISLSLYVMVEVNKNQTHTTEVKCWWSRERGHCVVSSIMFAQLGKFLAHLSVEQLDYRGSQGVWGGGHSAVVCCVMYVQLTSILVHCTLASNDDANTRAFWIQYFRHLLKSPFIVILKKNIFYINIPPGYTQYSIHYIYYSKVPWLIWIRLHPFRLRKLPRLFELIQ
jgi:hypothetical protein